MPVTDSLDLCSQLACQRERAFSGTSCRERDLRLCNGAFHFSPKGLPNFSGVLKDATCQSDIDLISGLPHPAKYEFCQTSQFHASPRQDIAGVRIACFGSRYHSTKQSSKIWRWSCVSAADQVVIRANAPMLENPIVQSRVAAGIERVSYSGHRLHSNPVPRTLIGDGVAPPTSARGAAGRVTPVGNGAGSREHHNSRSTAKSGLVRDHHVADDLDLRGRQLCQDCCYLPSHVFSRCSSDTRANGDDLLRLDRSFPAHFAHSLL